MTRAYRAFAPAVTALPADCASDAPATRATHFAGVDAARVFAACGVVWIHLVARTPYEHWNVLGRFGTPFFAAVGLFFLFFRPPGKAVPAWRTLVADRFRRLLLPFFFWFAVYAVLVVPAAGWRAVNHLWFLPFLFTSMVCAWPLVRVLQVFEFLRLPCAALLIVAGMLCAWFDLPLPQAGSEGWVLAHHVWAFVPATLWGGACGLLLSGARGLDRYQVALAPVGAMLLAGGIATLLERGSTYTVARSAAGVGWMLIALGLPRFRGTRVLAVVGRWGYGVYLIHPCVIIAGNWLARRAGWADSAGVMAVKFAATGAVSILVTAVLQRSGATAWLIPTRRIRSLPETAWSATNSSPGPLLRPPGGSRSGYSPFQGPIRRCSSAAHAPLAGGGCRG